ncbi:MAG: Lrp/AsnC family leucine-responsive transcriptional regulator [Candidatus Azotimanducaceae bacterium]
MRLIVTITFAKESTEAYEALEQQIKQAPRILQAYHVAGAEDYVMFVVGPSLQWYGTWSRQAFMTNPAIHRYDSRVVWSCAKFETAIPMAF